MFYFLTRLLLRPKGFEYIKLILLKSKFFGVLLKFNKKCPIKKMRRFTKKGELEMYKISATDSVGITKAKLDGQIVEGTLETLNSGQFSSGGKGKKGSRLSVSMKDSVDFQKDILRAAYSPKGNIVNTVK